ncbi:unnamed protein product [Commensalibacter communis]|uniref:Uncharacterized protein n=1 Tax=Commensalibacter communis TaxID=2972786 RepID=A0A9W4TQ18_9PROT|nr:hypothetical protein [Commensalibacter communis]CAI3953251.1 unnamed protein product [Commensalibacter communis]CAI3956320.1 unnamed protein product [Commensalibacter communis]CAI3956924.1 unnamed protein product [Commensalibacter communis]CAI3957335.1 unnamed protein product [Commensalibacter communis]
MWSISKKRCIQLQSKGSYYNNNSKFTHNLTLPTRYDMEYLDYSLDISSFLQDSSDRVQSISAVAKNMELLWISYARECILFKLHGGSSEQAGNLYCYVQTVGRRSFQVNLNQSIQAGQFQRTDVPPDIVPNLVQFPNTQPLSSSDEAFFFFG